MSYGIDNQKYYQSSDVAEYYSSYKTTLFRAEEVILRAIEEEFRNMPILEIGVGGGRLVPYLLALSKDYVGVDYSEHMIELCRKKFDGITFSTCNAKNMSMFKEGQFSVVVFWGNGLDDMGAYDRQMIFRECYRILKTNGILLFSSHNLDRSGILKASLSEGLTWKKWYNAVDPLRLKVLGWGLLKQLWGWVSDKEYVIFPYYEMAPHKVVLPTFWIRKEAQERQLLELGFSNVNALATDGKPLDSENRYRDFMIFYNARKTRSDPAGLMKGSRTKGSINC
jgi:ubiquinone/menaquinone biosynthesis C-methylase UbiE